MPKISLQAGRPGIKGSQCHAKSTVPNLYPTFPHLGLFLFLFQGLPLQVTSVSGGATAIYHLQQNSHWRIYIIAYLVRLIHTSTSL